MASKTVNTRIQLKSDTEMNWRKSVLKTDHQDGLKDSGSSFVPLAGELIIYSPDNGSPAYCRLKVGDGSHNVLELPFIDAGTIGGSSLNEIINIYNTSNDFPAIGQNNKLYVNLFNSSIYCYNNGSFKRLSHFTYSATTSTIPIIESWNQGVMTTISHSDNRLEVINGTEPTLTLGELTVVTGISEVNS